jgi:hypothetical protein
MTGAGAGAPPRPDPTPPTPTIVRLSRCRCCAGQSRGRFIQDWQVLDVGSDAPMAERSR